MAVLSDGELANELAIRDLAARFSDAVNRKHGGDLAGLFTSDGRWDVPGIPETIGPDAIRERFEGLVGQFPFLVQLLQSGVVEIEGDTARARWYLTEHARDAEGQGALFIGTYHDDLVLTGSGWRFAERRFRFLYRGRDELTGRAYPYEAPCRASG
ncbi:MAG TPA: nuclear transport factor 2 family protein [Acidimicrobiales bacterium]|nr:nuclear transport factor 2 family protein [Acidimicrobiales bacterium]